MQFDFSQKSVLITGAASGIGQAAALEFARSGARLALGDIDVARGEETADQVRRAGGEAFFQRMDVTRPEDAVALVKAAVEHYGKLDIAVNSAGVGGTRARTADYPEDVWRQVIEINLNGVWYSMKAELPPMLAAGQGVIVNLASVAGVVGFPHHAAYAASKHAVVGLTKTAALEYVRKGIRINALCPGFTDTPMVQQERDADPEFYQMLLRGVPARRLGTPQEAAAAILYLCSSEAGFTTGHCLVMDGGITAG